MQNEAANELVQELLGQSRRLNALLLSQEKRLAPDDLAVSKRIVAAVMGAIYVDGLRPLLQEHPSLEPDGLDV